jgi:hypothetical protein
MTQQEGYHGLECSPCRVRDIRHNLWSPGMSGLAFLNVVIGTICPVVIRLWDYSGLHGPADQIFIGRGASRLEFPLDLELC